MGKRGKNLKEKSGKDRDCGRIGRFRLVSQLERSLEHSW